MNIGRKSGIQELEFDSGHTDPVNVGTVAAAFLWADAVGTDFTIEGARDPDDSFTELLDTDGTQLTISLVANKWVLVPEKAMAFGGFIRFVGLGTFTGPLRICMKG